MKKQILRSLLTSAGVAVLFAPCGTVIAANAETQQTSTTQQTLSQQVPVVTQQVSTATPITPTQTSASNPEPAATSLQTDSIPTGSTYQRTFVISAYYSPIQGQKKYVTGSYSGDIRLNGGGVHSADGTPVFPGMVAAPKTYPFGTKMNIPGIGVVGVHDRGGAIVNAGQRNQSYDRIDVWMGYGDAGLQRALHWGKRKVDVTVYGVSSAFQENVNLDGYSQAEKMAETATGAAPKTFVQDLSLNDQSDSVKNLQNGLTKLGYYSGKISGDYDDATRAAVVKFQVDVGIVDTENDFGAGFFGPQTRKSLEDALNLKDSQVKNHLPQTPLSRDDQGDDVKKLQEALKQLGYDVVVTGVYDSQTIDAIFKFQKDHNVVSSESDFGAGVFGPKTMQILASNLAGVSFSDANAQESTVKPVIVFTKDLKYGDKGDDVRRLQEELKRMNYLGIDPSGYYGDVTQHAVLKFQEAEGLVASEKDTGAGYFGQDSRASIHEIIAQRQHVSDLMASKNLPAKKEEALAMQ